MLQRLTAWPSPQGMCPHSEGHRTGGGVLDRGVAAVAAFGFGDTLSDLFVSIRGRFLGANPPGLDKSNGLVTPTSRLFAPGSKSPSIIWRPIHHGGLKKFISLPLR